MNSSGTLRIAVKASLENLRSSGGSENMETQIDMRDYMFSQVLGKALGVHYELVPSLDGAFGRLLPNGSWTGITGLVVNGLADVAVMLAPNDERRKVITFSYPYFFDEITFVTQKPDIQQRVFAFIHPFSRDVWIALGVIFLAVSLVLKRSLGGRHKYDKVLLDMFGSLLKQSLVIKAGNDVNNLLYMTWIVGTMLMAYFYTAVLLSFMSIPPRSGLKNIADLSKALAEGSHQCKVLPGRVFGYELAKSDDESIRLVGRNIIQNTGGDRNAIDILQKRGMVFVGEKSDLYLLNNEYFISDDTFFVVMGSVAYRKKFCCFNEVHTAISRATEAGLFSKIVVDASFIGNIQHIFKVKGTELEKRLSLNDLAGAFIALICGHTFAFHVFLFEIANKRFRSKLQLNCHKQLNIEAKNSGSIRVLKKKRFNRPVKTR